MTDWTRFINVGPKLGETSVVHALELKSLSKKYKEVEAVREVSLTVQPGEIFGLLGPNGAGKTTIISCIVNMERPTAGSIEVFGNDVVKKSRERARLTGLVPQELVNHGFFNVWEVMRFHSGYYGLRNNEDHCEYLLKRLHLWDHRFKRVKQLSGGMKRRLLIAKALVHRPRLLLLDEPTAGVDIELRDNLWSFVRDLRDEGLSILLTTHYLEEAEELCDRVGILNQGEIKRIGATRDLIKDLTRREIVLHLEEKVHSFEHPFLKHHSDKMLIFSIHSGSTVGQLVSELPIDFAKVRDIQIQEGSLQDAFVEVLKEVTHVQP